MSMPHELDKVVSADEVGLLTARHGGHVLRSAFQLVYRVRAGRILDAAAAEGFLRPFRHGTPVPPRPYLDAMPDSKRIVAERLGMALHVANHRHLDVGGLDHVVAVGLSPKLSESLAALLAGSDVEPSRMICCVRQAGAEDSEAIAHVADVARAHGASVAIGGLDEGQPPLDAIYRYLPDIVRIDGAWFRRVSGNAGALRLLARLIEGFKADGAEVFIEGIETRRHLATALDAGADLVQGFLLSRPELAGMPIRHGSIRLDDIFAGEAEVIPLFGNGRR